MDYVVNGRLIHPVQVDASTTDGNGDGTGSGGAATTLFEDHGSIRALNDDFLTFLSSLDVLNEAVVDDAVLSFCDMCPGDEAGGIDVSPEEAGGANQSPVA